MVRSQIERELGKALDSPELAPMDIAAVVTRDGAKFTLALTVETTTGASREELTADDCALFARLIALKTALAAVPPQAARARALPPPAAAKPRAGELGLSVRTHALLATTPVPAPAIGVGIGAALRLAPFRFELGLNYWLPRQLRYAQAPGVGGEIRAWLVDLRACAVVPWRAVEIAGCLGPELAVLRGRGEGVERARSSDQLAGGVGAGVRANVPFGRTLGIWLGLDGLIALNRPEFHVRNLEGHLYRPPAVGLRGSLGLELRWP